MCVAEDIGNVLKGKAQVIRKGLCKGQADKSQLRHKEQNTKQNENQHCRTVKARTARNQPVLLLTALILEDQIKHKGNDRRDEQHKTRDAASAILEG